MITQNMEAKITRSVPVFCLSRAATAPGESIRVAQAIAGRGKISGVAATLRVRVAVRGPKHLKGWDVLYNIHFMLRTTFVTQQNNVAYITCYITCTQTCYITIKNVRYINYNQYIPINITRYIRINRMLCNKGGI